MQQNKGPVYFLDSLISKELGELLKWADSWAEQRKWWEYIGDYHRKTERKVGLSGVIKAFCFKKKNKKICPLTREHALAMK